MHENHTKMKKIVTSVVALVLMGSVSFAQDAPKKAAKPAPKKTEGASATTKPAPKKNGSIKASSF